ncbi:MAG: hypothetical protein H7343_00010 [Undibacterium sp.]|nr:hypothetical protein [Opitutaceae bacterium]
MNFPRSAAASVFCGLVALLTTTSTLTQAQPAGQDYASEPRGDFASRRAEILQTAAASKRSDLNTQVARLALSRGVIDEAAIDRSLAKINRRDDTADFDAVNLLRLYGYESPLIAAPMRAKMRDTLLHFKYWVDEPGSDLLSMWSENHQIGYHTAEYLAGQFFPDDTFTNNGRSGAWHRDAARTRILRWIEIKAKVGFSEWDSNSYYPVTMGALLALAELAADPAVATRAGMLLDLMFFDMAVDSFRGTYGTSHGRCYTGTILGGGRNEGTSSLQYLAWGLGSPGGGDATLALAASQRYRVSPTVVALARDLPEEFVNRERQSLLIEDAKKFGLNYAKPEDFWLLNEGGKFRTRENIEASFRVTDLWSETLHRYGVVIKPYGEAVLATYRELAARGQPVPDLDRTSLQRVDKITYRTPDYQLSTAQDYRKGAPGFQQHIWQATVGPDTPVFTINPGPTAKYWQGRFPRNAQFKNVLVSIYNIPSEQPPGPKTVVPADAAGNAMPSPSPSEDTLVPRTYAVLRRALFDEVAQRGPWTFARKGHAYLALASRNPTAWSDAGVLGGAGLIAEGRQNIWICQLGREALDGSFPAWSEKIFAAPLVFSGTTDALAVDYAAPGVGRVNYGWDGPLRIDGRAEPLTDYARFDNPYCLSPYGSGRYEISHAGHRLLLDFNTGERRETAP